MIPLMISEKERNEIKELIAKASKDYTPLEKMLSLKNGEPAPSGMNDRYTMLIPYGFQVTYTHEEQPESIMCRHMSVSVLAKGRAPNLIAIGIIMEEFGFKNKLKDVIYWTEKFGDEDQMAVNVVEPVNGDMSLFKIKSK